MFTKEINERSPLRVFEISIHGGLGKGNLGVVMSRAGVLTRTSGGISVSSTRGPMSCAAKVFRKRNPIATFPFLVMGHQRRPDVPDQDHIARVVQQLPEWCGVHQRTRYRVTVHDNGAGMLGNALGVADDTIVTDMFGLGYVKAPADHHGEEVLEPVCAGLVHAHDTESASCTRSSAQILFTPFMSD